MPPLLYITFLMAGVEVGHCARRAADSVLYTSVAVESRKAKTAANLKHSGEDVGKSNEVDLDNLYQQFYSAWAMDTPIRDVVREWRALCDAMVAKSQLSEKELSKAFKNLPWSRKDASAKDTVNLLAWTPNEQNSTVWLHGPASELKRRIAWPVYKKQHLEEKWILVVGAGLGGLRLAIEARLNGAHVEILEKRARFDHQEVLHLSGYSTEDLVSLGIKDIWPDFVKRQTSYSGANLDMKNVPVAYLQHALLRTALVLGVHVYPDCAFTGFQVQMGELYWGAKATCRPSHAFDFEAIVDSTGPGGGVYSKNVVNDVPLLKALPISENLEDSYAIIANFKPEKGVNRADFSLVREEDEKTFRRKKKIALQAVQYSRNVHGVNHMVAVLRKRTLLDNRALQSDEPLTRNDTHIQALMVLAVAIAKEWDIPYMNGFYDQGGPGALSMAALDFSVMANADKSIGVMPETPTVVASSYDDKPDDYSKYVCCCRPEPCNCSVFNKFKEGKVDVKDAAFPDGVKEYACCKPRKRRCDRGDDGKYKEPAPFNLGLDHRCRDIRPGQCEIAATGAIPTTRIGLFKGEETCKCPDGTRLSGPSKECTGRKFNHQGFEKYQCSCKKTQAVLAVGGSLISPFWPEGPGVNSAFSGAAQHIWNLVDFFKLAHDAERFVDAQLSVQSSKRFSMLKNSSTGSCGRCHYQDFIKRGYEGHVEQVCKPGGSACNGPFSSYGPFD